MHVEAFRLDFAAHSKADNILPCLRRAADIFVFKARSDIAVLTVVQFQGHVFVGGDVGTKVSWVLPLPASKTIIMQTHANTIEGRRPAKTKQAKKVHVLWSSDWFRRPGFSTYPICDRGCLVEHVPGDEPRARLLRVCVQAIHVCFLGYPTMLNCHRDFLVEQALGPFHDTGFFAYALRHITQPAYS